MEEAVEEVPRLAVVSAQVIVEVYSQVIWCSVTVRLPRVTFLLCFAFWRSTPVS